MCDLWPLLPKRRKLSLLKGGRLVIVLLLIQLLLVMLFLRGQKSSIIADLSVPTSEVDEDHCSVAPTGPCRVAIISTWPPARCGIAEFSKELVAALRALPEFSAHCYMEVLPVVPFHDKKENYRVVSGAVGEPIVDDKTIPFESFYHNNLEYIRRLQFTHVVIQQEYGLTSIQWQLNDIARWLAPFVHVITVVHTPRAYPNIEETGLVRQLADNSKYLVVMSWHAVHSLVHAYGIERSKIVFVPHGVTIPTTVGLPAVVSDWFPPELQRQDTLIAVSFGLIHEHKGLHRVVRIMKSIVESFPHFYFVIAGMEHPSISTPVMPKLFELAKEAGVESNLVWINRYLSQDETHWLHRRADVVLSLYDEITPTSGTILKAMSYGRAIIATHYRFANEVLQGGRGCLVPFEDDRATLKCFTDFLGNKALRTEMGARAFEFVSHWNWEQVAKEYAKLLFLTASGKPHRSHCSLTGDPFDSERFASARLHWKGNEIQLFDRRIVGPVLQSNMCVLYVDHVLQVNAKLNEHRAVVAVSIETPTFLALVNPTGADVEFKPNTELSSYESLSYRSSQVVIQSLNVHFRASVVEGQVEFVIHRVNVFAAPRGIFGDAISMHYDLSHHATRDLFSDVHGSANILFSHNFPCQRWSFFEIDVNIYRLPAQNIPQGVFTKIPKPEKNVTFTIEGPIFNLESFAMVNRQMFLQLFWTHVQVLLKPTDSFSNVDVAASVDVALVSGAFLTQTASTPTDILFRNAWPPNFQRPEEHDGRPIKYVHQQPWEFTSIPKSWVSPLQNIVDEVWVPSAFCRDIYVDNYIDAAKVHVIPHGVSYKKFQLENQTVRLPTNRSFVFFFIGGLLPRKGIDVLLKAYTTTFGINDDVALLIHSIYGDNFQKDKILSFLRMRHLLPEFLPEIVFRQSPFTWSEYVQMLNSVDAFVSPFRSEGFGLTILEAMAKGIAPIIPYFGPPKEFAPNSSAFYIGASLKDCVSTPPCGKMTMFGEPTVHQAQWGEPSVKELAAALHLVYNNRHETRRRGAQAHLEASKHTWDAVGRRVLERINLLSRNR
jgi:glycosyltransferase involved in cell wall biosynthesis